jgi:predicted XRE-type DNA-binding protein
MVSMKMRNGRDMSHSPKHRGTDNVLMDLGFADAEGLTAKTILAKKLNDIIARRGLTQSDAAKLLGMPQPKVSAIRNYKLRGISLERLMQALTALGQHIEIVVRPSSGRVPARIDVAA